MARLTREESRERTREHLLEAARMAVARNGYDGTSIADIAEAAGQGCSTLLHGLH